jgi:trehalose synthase
MSALHHVPIAPMDPKRFESVLGDGDYAELLGLIDRASGALDSRVVWNVNSTAKGGGVAEMLLPLIGYSRGAGVDARWVVISGNARFFEVTKRLHNHLHGFAGDGGPLGNAERLDYERALSAEADELVPMVHSQDVVILHDPQTAGLISAVKRTGATVIWRCHVGLDDPNDDSRAAWDFLHRYVSGADACVFSREAFAWDGLDQERTSVIQPSIDAFSPKNAEQTREQSLAILSRAGMIVEGAAAAPSYERADGTPSRVDRVADMGCTGRVSAADRLVLQVSRWDALKDPLGVLKGFARHVSGEVDAHLMLAGPATASVSDDPEGAAVFAQVQDAWDRLPAQLRGRVHLACLPMDDAEENAAIVNALQRHADVVVQKSLAEGFGLTVAEAMWKQRPVVASGIGGIQDQIVDGESGALIADPGDLRTFGETIVGLLSDSERARVIGAAAHQRVQHQFLGPHHLGRYFELIERLL